MKTAAPAQKTPMLATTPALSAGFERVTVPDPDGQPLEAGVWYPSEAPAFSQPIGLYQQSVAVGGAVAGRNLPLIVMSHGSGGSFEGHYDTAAVLAEAGFVAAAVTHTGDNYRDHSGFTRVENRPRHIKALVDFMLASWPHHDLLDPARIGMFGFSAGGFTALVTVGGIPDLARVAPYCIAHPDEWACRKAKEYRSEAMAPPAAFVHDQRISAAVIAAPRRKRSPASRPQSSFGVATTTNFRIRGTPRMCTRDCRRSPNTTSCPMPGISPSWRPVPRWPRVSRLRSAAIPRASIAWRSIANSILPWWPSSRQSCPRRRSRMEQFLCL
jgi:hypothetical protein